MDMFVTEATEATNWQMISCEDIVLGTVIYVNFGHAGKQAVDSFRYEDMLLLKCDGIVIA